DVLLRGRVTIGVDTDVAVEINHALQHLIDRWQDSGQRRKIRFLDEIGRLRRHAQRTLGLLIGDITAPGQGLAVQVVEVGEAAPGQKVPFYVGELPFDSTFSIGITNGVGAKTKNKSAGKSEHLRGEHSIGTRAGDNQRAGVVDHTTWARAVIEAGRLKKEVLRLKAGVARVVLKEQPARIAEHQPGALCLDRLAIELHAVRGGIVLHLLARAKVILARALRWGAQLCCPDPACERAVGLPRRRDELCPARALEIWLAAAGIASGPIFRMISKGGIVAASRLTPL